MTTLADLFGTNAERLTASGSITLAAGDEAIVIKKSDFTDWTSADGAKPERWLAAVIGKITAFDAADTTDAPDFESSMVTRTLATRNNADKLGFVYQITIYQPAGSLPATPDPDLMV